MSSRSRDSGVKLDPTAQIEHCKADTATQCEPLNGADQIQADATAEVTTVLAWHATWRSSRAVPAAPYRWWPING